MERFWALWGLLAVFIVPERLQELYFVFTGDYRNLHFAAGAPRTTAKAVLRAANSQRGQRAERLAGQDRWPHGAADHELSSLVAQFGSLLSF